MLAHYFRLLQSYPGWIAIHVLVPTLLPLAVIAAVAVATGGKGVFIRMLKKAVNQGQLFWVVLGMLASAGYEAFLAYGTCPDLRALGSWGLGICIVGALVSSIFIALNTSRSLDEQSLKAPIIWLSILMTIIFIRSLHAKLKTATKPGVRQ